MKTNILLFTALLLVAIASAAYAIVPDGPPIVPEPVSSILFLTGGVALGVRIYLKRKKNHK